MKLEKYVYMTMERVQKRESNVQNSQEGSRDRIWNTDEGGGVWALAKRTVSNNAALKTPFVCLS